MPDEGHFNTSRVVIDGVATVHLTEHITRPKEGLGSCTWDLDVLDTNGQVVANFVVEADDIELIKL